MRHSLEYLWITACSLAGIGFLLATTLHTTSLNVGVHTHSSTTLLTSASAAAKIEDPNVDGQPPAVASTIRYSRDIRPMLSDRCFTCHGPDASHRQAELRLDEREFAIQDRNGDAAIVPGSPENSLLWQRITSTRASEVMPPPDSGKHALSPSQLATFKQWILEGAHYEAHWSFIPPVRPPVPAAAAGTNPIDSFINQRLRESGVTANPPADPAIRLRRLHLDLTGLPPTPQQLAEFEQNPSPLAFEKWIDTIFTQEPYASRHAEHMASPWLDQARYADTSGIHTDAGRSIWLWRDWVIQAYRNNMQFDQFVVEQLAGDLLPDATIAQKVATGFNRNHVTSDEGGAINEEYLLEYAVDRVSTTGLVFMGLTLGCARCHDHKYDPISAADFYGMIAYFNSVEEPGIYSQIQDSQRAFEPFLDVPSPQQSEAISLFESQIAAARASIEQVSPEDHALHTEYVRSLAEEAGVSWSTLKITSANSSGGSTLTVQNESDVIASGPVPDHEVFELIGTLPARSTSTPAPQLFAIEVMADPAVNQNRPGRSTNGNAMLTGIEIFATTTPNDTSTPPLKLIWAWADIEQTNGDFGVNALLQPGVDRGWALNGHNQPGSRVALFLSETPLPSELHTHLKVRLKFESPYVRHSFGQVRIHASPISQAGLDRLPVTFGAWHQVGPFDTDRDSLFGTSFGPEEPNAFDFEKSFPPRNIRWKLDLDQKDGTPRTLPSGINANYLARRAYSPTPRSINVLLGSDDSIRVFANGKDVFQNQTQRGVALDQDSATLPLISGSNDLVFKVVNTGGEGGFAYRLAPKQTSTSQLPSDLVAALLPKTSLNDDLNRKTFNAWRQESSPDYNNKLKVMTETEAKLAETRRAIPRTMVMSEMATPRPTFVLTRGQYNLPDPARPVSRSVPRAIGTLKEEWPANRLGLAKWLVSADHPLTARVTVNRLWAQIFGNGLVRTQDDFGLQGEWPSHPELLDWLAVEFVDSGWDVQHLLKLILTSDAYQRSSLLATRGEDLDPENRLLSRFPRQRLDAEQIRDSALWTSGLLYEKVGGPSVKPIQPDGLWEEVSMPASNTKSYQTSMGKDLWRRSLYTYWKRASPPPNMQIFDAPTRESCVTQRVNTNTPLQALVLWNDPQLVEAARSLAARVIASSTDDSERLNSMMLVATGEKPSPQNLSLMLEALNAFRTRFAQTPDDAKALLRVGSMPAAPANSSAAPDEAATPSSETPPAELAAWTMIANAVFSTDAFVVKD